MSRLSTAAPTSLFRLPASLIATVCHGLTLCETLTILRSTCRHLYGSITPACFQHSTVTINELTIDAFNRSSITTRALLEQLPSLVIDCQQPGRGRDDATDAEMERVLALYELRSPGHPELFVFPALRSLRVAADSLPQAVQVSHHRGRSGLFRSSPQSLQRLTNLDIAVVFAGIDDNDFLSLMSAAVNLTRLRLGMVWTATERLSSPSSLPKGMSGAHYCPQLFLTLQSLPHLTHLDCQGAQPFPADCASAAPLLQRLTSLRSGRLRLQQMQSMLACLTGASPSSSLRQLTLSSQECQSWDLLTVFELPSLQVLDVHELHISLEQLAGFCRGAACIPRPSPLMTLDFIDCGVSRNEDAVHVDYIAQHLGLFLTRLTTLRSLRCISRFYRSQLWDAAVTSAVLNYSKSSSARQLNTLSVEFKHSFPSEDELAGLSLSGLTEFSLIAMSATLSDLQLTAVLTAIPNVLRLRLNVHRQSSDAMTMIATHCPALLELCVAGGVKDGSTRTSALTSHRQRSSLAVPSPFLPRLISLSIDDGDVKDGSSTGHLVRAGAAAPPVETEALVSGRPYSFDIVHHLTHPPCRSLQLVRLYGVALTSAHILSLSSLSSLSAVVCDLFDNAGQRTMPADAVRLLTAARAERRAAQGPVSPQAAQDMMATLQAMLRAQDRQQYPAYEQLAAVAAARLRMYSRLSLPDCTSTKDWRIPLWPVPANRPSTDADTVNTPLSSQQHDDMVRRILSERRSLQGAHRKDGMALVGRRDVSVDTMRSTFFEELAALLSTSS